MPEDLPLFDPACLATAREWDLAILPLSAHAVAMDLSPTALCPFPTASHLPAFGFAMGSADALRRWSISLLADGSPGIRLLAEVGDAPPILAGGRAPKAPTPPPSENSEPVVALTVPRGRSELAGLLPSMLARLPSHVRHHRTEIPLSAALALGPRLPWLSMDGRGGMATSLRSILIMDAHPPNQEGDPAGDEWRGEAQRLALEALFLSWRSQADGFDIAIAWCPMPGQPPLSEDDLGMGPFNPPRLFELRSRAQGAWEDVVQALRASGG